MLLLHMAAQKLRTMINSSGKNVSGCGSRNWKTSNNMFLFFTQKCPITCSLSECWAIYLINNILIFLDYATLYNIYIYQYTQKFLKLKLVLRKLLSLSSAALHCFTLTSKVNVAWLFGLTAYAFPLFVICPQLTPYMLESDSDWKERRFTFQSEWI